MHNDDDHNDNLLRGVLLYIQIHIDRTLTATAYYHMYRYPIYSRSCHHLTTYHYRKPINCSL